MSYTPPDLDESTSDPKSDEKYREWVLQPQSEYRFELAPNTSIGIKVRGYCDPRRTLAFHFTHGFARISSWTDMLSVLVLSLLRV